MQRKQAQILLEMILKVATDQGPILGLCFPLWREVSRLMKYCCTQVFPARRQLCAQGPKLGPQSHQPSLSVLVLGSALIPLAAKALRRSHPEMTTWLVRLTVLL